MTELNDVFRSLTANDIPPHPEDIIDMEKLESMAEEVPASTFTISDLVASANRYLKLDEELVELEAKVAEIKKKKEALEMQEMVDIMRGLRLKMFELDNGAEVKVDKFLKCSLSDKTTKPNAIAWLKRTERTALLSNTIELTFKKGDEERLTKAVEALGVAGFPVTPHEDVNTATFKSLCNELIESGKESELPPDNEIGLFRGTKVDITLPKAKPAKKAK